MPQDNSDRFYDLVRQIEELRNAPQKGAAQEQELERLWQEQAAMAERSDYNTPRKDVPDRYLAQENLPEHRVMQSQAMASKVRPEDLPFLMRQLMGRGPNPMTGKPLDQKNNASMEFMRSYVPSKK